RLEALTRVAGCGRRDDHGTVAQSVAAHIRCGHFSAGEYHAAIEARALAAGHIVIGTIGERAGLPAGPDIEMHTRYIQRTCDIRPPLEVCAVLAGRLKARAVELARDVRGCGFESRTRRVAPLECVGREESDTCVKVLRRDALYGARDCGRAG